LNGKWGYIDTLGNMVIQPQYDMAYSFYENITSVKEGEKWGFINKKGELVIKSKYDYAYPFFHGVANIGIGEDFRTRKWGYIDTLGEYIRNPLEVATGVDSSSIKKIFKIQNFKVIDIFPILAVRDVDRDGLEEILIGYTNLEPKKNLDKPYYELYIWEYDSLKDRFYECEHKKALTDTQYWEYIHSDEDKMLDMSDYILISAYQDDEKKFSEFLPENFKINTIVYHDIDMDGDNDVILNISIIKGEPPFFATISNDSILFLENHLEEYERWFSDAMDDVSKPGKIQIKDLDGDGISEILFWGCNYDPFGWGEEYETHYLQIYKYKKEMQ